MICPHCQADVPNKALACPECGSDAETGWARFAHHSGDLPEEEEEQATSQTISNRSWLHWSAAIALLLGFLLWGLPRLPTGVYCLALILGGALALIRRGTKAVTPSGLGERELYLELMMNTGGDEKLVERLIDFERKRSPSSKRLEHLKTALERLERDRS